MNPIAKVKKNRKLAAQGLVEFAVVLPLMLMVIFVIIELGRVFHAWLAVENGARMGIRYAVVAELNAENCAGGGSGGKCLHIEDERDARIQSIHDAAWAGSASILRVEEAEVEEREPSFFKVTVCRPEALVKPASKAGLYHCNPEDPGAPGELVSVVVEFNHPLILPVLNSIWPQIRLNARRDARVEDWKTANPEGVPPIFEVPDQPDPPPVVLCQEWEDLHAHRPMYEENYLGIIIHEAHGWPMGPSVNQVILRSVVIRQEQGNPELLRIDDLEVGHPPIGNVIFPVGAKSLEATISVNRELVFCYANYCDSAYRGFYVTAFFDGTLDGVYSLEAEIFFPEYSKSCKVSGEMDTNAPPPDPVDPPDPIEPPDPPDPPDPGYPPDGAPSDG